MGKDNKLELGTQILDDNIEIELESDEGVTPILHAYNQIIELLEEESDLEEVNQAVQKFHEEYGTQLKSSYPELDESLNNLIDARLKEGQQVFLTEIFAMLKEFPKYKALTSQVKKLQYLFLLDQQLMSCQDEILRARLKQQIARLKQQPELQQAYKFVTAISEKLIIFHKKNVFPYSVKFIDGELNPDNWLALLSQLLPPDISDLGLENMQQQLNTLSDVCNGTTMFFAYLSDALKLKEKNKGESLENYVLKEQNKFFENKEIKSTDLIQEITRLNQEKTQIEEKLKKKYPDSPFMTREDSDSIRRQEINSLIGELKELQNSKKLLSIIEAVKYNEDLQKLSRSEQQAKILLKKIKKNVNSNSKETHHLQKVDNLIKQITAESEELQIKIGTLVSRIREVNTFQPVDLKIEDTLTNTQALYLELLKEKQLTLKNLLEAREKLPILVQYNKIINLLKNEENLEKVNQAVQKFLAPYGAELRLYPKLEKNLNNLISERFLWQYRNTVNPLNNEADLEKVNKKFRAYGAQLRSSNPELETNLNREIKKYNANLENINTQVFFTEIFAMLKEVPKYKAISSQDPKDKKLLYLKQLMQMKLRILQTEITLKRDSNILTQEEINGLKKDIHIQNQEIEKAKNKLKQIVGETSFNEILQAYNFINAIYEKLITFEEKTIAPAFNLVKKQNRIPKEDFLDLLVELIPPNISNSTQELEDNIQQLGKLSNTCDYMFEKFDDLFIALSKKKDEPKSLENHILQYQKKFLEEKQIKSTDLKQEIVRIEEEHQKRIENKYLDEEKNLIDKLKELQNYKTLLPIIENVKYKEYLRSQKSAEILLGKIKNHSSLTPKEISRYMDKIDKHIKQFELESDKLENEISTLLTKERNTDQPVDTELQKIWESTRKSYGKLKKQKNSTLKDLYAKKSDLLKEKMADIIAKKTGLKLGTLQSDFKLYLEHMHTEVKKFSYLKKDSSNPEVVDRFIEFYQCLCNLINQLPKITSQTFTEISQALIFEVIKSNTNNSFPGEILLSIVNYIHQGYFKKMDRYSDKDLLSILDNITEIVYDARLNKIGSRDQLKKAKQNFKDEFLKIMLSKNKDYYERIWAYSVDRFLESITENVYDKIKLNPDRDIVTVTTELVNRFFGRYGLTANESLVNKILINQIIADIHRKTHLENNLGIMKDQIKKIENIDQMKEVVENFKKDFLRAYDNNPADKEYYAKIIDNSFKNIISDINKSKARNTLRETKSEPNTNNPITSESQSPLQYVVKISEDINVNRLAFGTNRIDESDKGPNTWVAINLSDNKETPLSPEEIPLIDNENDDLEQKSVTTISTANTAKNPINMTDQEILSLVEKLNQKNEKDKRFVGFFTNNKKKDTLNTNKSARAAEPNILNT